MQYITEEEFHINHSAVALGKFEGIHRGHQLLLNAIRHPDNTELQSVVFTFSTPPAVLLKHAEGYQTIYTKEERHEILEQLGMDVLIEYPFTREFAAQTPEEFIKNILVKKVGAKLIVVGEDFHFGKKRSGSVRDLEAYAGECGYELRVIPKLQMEGEDVSSTRIRRCLAAGQMEKASMLLGRPYSITGTVVHGKALGRTIQIPTINQIVEDNKLAPPNGVYVSRVILPDDSQVHYGITNVGVKPTIEQNLKKGVETNIFDYEGDLYDQNVRVELLHYRRPEMKFDSIEALTAQMQSDIAYGKEYAAGVDDTL